MKGKRGRKTRKCSHHRKHAKAHRCKNRYMLMCTECSQLFPPRTFRDQIREFRMCKPCKKKNPEICKYLEKYLYHPMPIESRTPVQRIIQRCELLKLKLIFSMRDYDNTTPPKSPMESKKQAIRLLQSLIEKFEIFESGGTLDKSHLTEEA